MVQNDTASADGNGILHTSVLVLNRCYLALRVVSVRRAFVMLCRDAAEVIHIQDGVYANYDFTTWCELSAFWSDFFQEQDADGQADWIRTVRFRVQVPRVIRLLGYDQVPRQAVRLNRRSLFARDGHRCQYCGQDFPSSQLSFDHVTPRSRGGDTEWENVVTCCLTCNSKKGDRTPVEAGMQLRRRPTRPVQNPILRVQMGHPRYRVWLPFLGGSSHAVDVA
jgi:5-methylcytosine-specific restriction endonuclease McrA